MSITEEKKKLRSEMLHKRNLYPFTLRKQEDMKLLSKLTVLKEFAKAKVFLTYVSYESEADTKALIERALLEKKLVGVPKIMAKGRMEFYQIHSLEELKPGRLNIPEPEPLPEALFDARVLKSYSNEIFLCIPGLAFDKERNRLGYGGGFYDRYLERLLNEQILAVKAGYGYSFQQINNVPVSHYDRKLDMIIT